MSPSCSDKGSRFYCWGKASHCPRCIGGREGGNSNDEDCNIVACALKDITKEALELEGRDGVDPDDRVAEDVMNATNSLRVPDLKTNMAA
eukprot:14221940-Ditylum_brightwellii.AAC.1